jgi:hypothetical protein
MMSRVVGATWHYTQNGRLQASVRAMVQAYAGLFPFPWQRYVMLFVLFMSSGMLIAFAETGERARPVRIGVLTPFWGPSPQVVGLRDGLVELGDVSTLFILLANWSDSVSHI